MSEVVEIFTDGACKGNPGPGGWAAILRWNGAEKELSGGERHTTNNRMEMMAAISALEALKRSCQVRITTDSEYLKNGITKWIQNWKRRGWVTSQNTPVKNAELWKRLDEVAGRHQVEWRWVRGHSAHEENERCDTLAKSAMKQFLR